MRSPPAQGYACTGHEPRCPFRNEYAAGEVRKCGAQDNEGHTEIPEDYRWLELIFGEVPLRSETKMRHTYAVETGKSYLSKWQSFSARSSSQTHMSIGGTTYRFMRNRTLGGRHLSLIELVRNLLRFRIPILTSIFCRPVLKVTND
jgi:hypothetical protein